MSPATALASLERIADVGTKALAALPNGQGGGTIVVLPVQRPAEIVNYRSMGATPTVLVSGLAVGAVVALGLTLVASVRRRRRDLALLKTLGFTRRQLAATVAWQASLVAVIGTIVGAPLGVVLGRWLWVLFAHEIYAVPDPTVPLRVHRLRCARRARPREPRRLFPRESGREDPDGVDAAYGVISARGDKWPIPPVPGAGVTSRKRHWLGAWVEEISAGGVGSVGVRAGRARGVGTPTSTKTRPGRHRRRAHLLPRRS